MPTDGEAPRRGLLVDYGGVLTTDVFSSFTAFCQAEGLEPDLVAHHFRSNPEARQLLFDLEVGRITEQDFEPRFAAVIGVAEPAGLIDRLFAGMHPDHAMVNAVHAAKDAGVRTGLISNSWGKGRYDRSQFPVLFDGVVISGEVGLHKPQPEIFELGAERIGLPPFECVFVDDLRENCAGAEAVGMTAVLHRQTDQTIASVEELLGIELAARA